MKINEIRETPTDDLVKRLNEIAKKIFELRCTTERLTPQKGGEIRALKREFARVKTVIRQRELTDEVKAALTAIDARLAEIDAKRSKDRTIDDRFANFKLRGRKAQLQRVARELEIVKGK